MAPSAASAAEALMPPAEQAAASSSQAAGPSTAGQPASANAKVTAVAPTLAGVLQLRTTAPSWVEVVDASGQAIVGRLVQPGEALSLDGAMPFKLRIGNATGTQVLFRGQPVPLAPYTRDNVARFELK